MNHITSSGSDKNKLILSKVPQITVFFWIIKVLCTTVGETASDFLNVNLGFGLIRTSVVVGVLLAIALFFQFKAKKYIPGIYWVSVVLISVFGTLVTDNMTDAMGIPLEFSTVFFSILLALTFAFWYMKEKTLSIHSIFTMRREAFYWLAILFTFALGTAAGDLMAESLGLGYLVTGIIVIAVVVAVSIAWRFGLDSVLSFWIIYIMTRPLGASLGDYMSQPSKYGGLGLGATITSVIFLAAILMTVVFLAITKKDTIVKKQEIEAVDMKRHGVLLQVVAVICVLALASGTGYYFRHKVLMNETVNTASQSSSFDLSSFITIEEDAQNLVSKGNFSDAKSCADDLEYTWDNAEANLKPLNKEKWIEVDGTIDDVLRQLRAINPDADACKSALEASLAAMK